MIATLARSRLRMLWHRAAISTWPEWLGALFLVAVYPYFWFVISRFLFTDPEFLYNTVRVMGVAGLNRITISLVETVFLIVVLVGVTEEITELFRTEESGFLLGFPVSSGKYFVWRLLSSTLRVLVAMAIGLPVILVYVFYFHRTLEPLAFAGSVALLAGALVGGGVFLAAVVQLLASLIAILLSRVQQRRVIVGGLALYGIAGWMTVRPLVEQAKQSDLVTFGKALAGTDPDWWTTVWNWLPPSRFMAALEVVDRGNLSAMGEALAAGMIGLAGTVWLSGVILRAFCFEEPGMLREQAQQRQSQTAWAGYGWFLSRLPAPERGIVFEEGRFIRRCYWLQLWLLVVPNMIVPLLIPQRFLSLLVGSETTVFATHAFCILVLVLDPVMADLGQKANFLPLMVTLPVDLRRFFATKAMIYADALIVLLLIALAAWSWVLSFPVETALVLCLGSMIAAYSFAWMTLGVCAGYRSFSPQLDQPGGGNAMIPFFAAGASATFSILLTTALKVGLPWLAPTILILWAIVGRFVFVRGIGRLVDRLEGAA